jgi:hypothetical protein
MTLFWNVSTETPTYQDLSADEHNGNNLTESGPEHISAPYLYYRPWRNSTIRCLTYLKQRNENNIICVEGMFCLCMQLPLFAERLLQFL